MQRRTFLTVAGTAAVGKTGLTAASTGRSSFTAQLSFPSYVLSMDEQLPDEPESSEVTDLEEINDRAAAAIETAIDEGTYETDDVDEAVLEGLHHVQSVERDGTVYEIDFEMPEYVVSSRDAPESAVDPDRTISRSDDRVRQIDVDNQEIAIAVNAVLAPSAPSSEGGARDVDYRATVLDENLEAFLDEYDYVAYPSDGSDGREVEGYVELELAHEDPGPPYTITAAEVPPEQRYGRSVVDVSVYPRIVESALRRAAGPIPYRSHRRPPGIDRVLEDDAYVRVDGDVYEPSFDVIDHDEVPVSLEIADVDPADQSFTLALEADGEAATVSGGVPAPFEVLYAGRWHDRDDGGPLWSDVYEESEHVDIEYEDGDPTIWTHSIAVTTSLEPGDPVTETYEVRPDWGVDDGFYRVESSLSISWDGGESEYPYIVWLSVPDLE